MENENTELPEKSGVVWENLQESVLGKVRDFIQDVMEAEVTELLGRRKSERRRYADGAARRYKKVPNAAAVVWRMLMVAETRFRRLNEPDLLKEVYQGVTFRDGERVENCQGDRLAA